MGQTDAGSRAPFQPWHLPPPPRGFQPQKVVESWQLVFYSRGLRDFTTKRSSSGSDLRSISRASLGPSGCVQATHGQLCKLARGPALWPYVLGPGGWISFAAFSVTVVITQCLASGPGLFLLHWVCSHDHLAWTGPHPHGLWSDLAEGDHTVVTIIQGGCFLIACHTLYGARIC